MYEQRGGSGGSRILKRGVPVARVEGCMPHPLQENFYVF